MHKTQSTGVLLCDGGCCWLQLGYGVGSRLANKTGGALSAGCGRQGKEGASTENSGDGNCNLDVVDRSDDGWVRALWQLAREPLVDGIGLVDAVIQG